MKWIPGDAELEKDMSHGLRRTLVSMKVLIHISDVIPARELTGTGFSSLDVKSSLSPMAVSEGRDFFGVGVKNESKVRFFWSAILHCLLESI